MNYYRKFKLIFKCFLFVLLLNFMTFFVFLVLNEKEIDGVVSDEIGMQVYYDNKRFIDGKIYRDYNKIYKLDERNYTPYKIDNFRFVAGATNETDAVQEISYASSQTIGEIVTPGIKLQFKQLFEAELKYSINLAKTTTTTATAKILPYKGVAIYAMEMIYRDTDIWTLVTLQVLRWFSWHNNGYLGHIEDLVKSCCGTYYHFVQYDV